MAEDNPTKTEETGINNSSVKPRGRGRRTTDRTKNTENPKPLSFKIKQEVS